MDYKINLYTDGAAKGNPGPGGYGLILEWNQHIKEHSEGFKRTTNNRMELLAVIKGLELIKAENANVTVYTDSRYVADAIEKRWLASWVKTNFKGKKNADLWMKFLPLYEKHRVKFIWIKGHNNHQQNERCDQLAVEAALSKNLKTDEGFESGLYN